MLSMTIFGMLEYVQGMNDLLSPLYFVVGEEALAFWMFTDLMQRQVL